MSNYWDLPPRTWQPNLNRRLLTHSGELGTAREQIIREFLGAYLPKRFEVSTGFAFDCAGRISKQLDIVIFDSQICPRFETPGGKFLFPCEAIVAVGQVKSSLTSRPKFKEVLDNLNSVKALDRSANGTARDSRFNEKLCPSENHLHQIFTFLFMPLQECSGSFLLSQSMVILAQKPKKPVFIEPKAILRRVFAWAGERRGRAPEPQFAAPPVATRNGLTQPTRIGASTVSEWHLPKTERCCKATPCVL